MLPQELKKRGQVVPPAPVRSFQLFPASPPAEQGHRLSVTIAEYPLRKPRLFKTTRNGCKLELHAALSTAN